MVSLPYIDNRQSSLKPEYYHLPKIATNADLKNGTRNMPLGQYNNMIKSLEETRKGVTS